MIEPVVPPLAEPLASVPLGAASCLPQPARAITPTVMPTASSLRVFFMLSLSLLVRRWTG